jgi:hypothetical protein
VFESSETTLTGADSVQETLVCCAAPDRLPMTARYRPPSTLTKGSAEGDIARPTAA